MSPVIGVILMVAITVILAAVIAAFVFGMAGNVGPSKNVAVTASLAPNTTATYTANTDIIETYQGGKDNDQVTKITMLIDGTAQMEFPTAAAGTSPAVGAQAHWMKPAGDTAKHHATAVAVFKDGSSQIVLDVNI